MALGQSLPVIPTAQLNATRLSGVELRSSSGLENLLPQDTWKTFQKQSSWRDYASNIQTRQYHNIGHRTVRKIPNPHKRERVITLPSGVNRIKQNRLRKADLPKRKYSALFK